MPEDSNSQNIKAPNIINPVETAAEKYIFFLDSLFFLNLILFNKIFILVLLFEDNFVFSSKYLAVNLALDV